MLMIEKVPNITRPQNRVNSCFFFFSFVMYLQDDDMEDYDDLDSSQLTICQDFSR